MVVLVTRPQPDDEATAAALRARDFEVLKAPMLRFEPVAFQDDTDAAYGAVIVTSANALRGIEPHLENSRLMALPLFAVGERTADAARDAGFENVLSAARDAASPRQRRLRGTRPADPASPAFLWSPRRLTGWPRYRACRAKYATLSPPTG